MAKQDVLTPQPEKVETLANKQIRRLRRLNHLKNRFTVSARWWVTMGERITLGILFGVNFFLLLPFFGQEDSVNVFSAPVVPAMAGLLELFIPFSYSVRLVLVIFILFFPLSYYWLIREISGRRFVAFLATLLSLLPTSIFLAIRVEHALFIDDGAHIASLTLVPIVCLLLLRFLREGNYWKGIAASLGTAIVALTSPVGFLVLVAFMVILTFSEILLGEGRLKGMRLLVIITLAAGFSSFWYNPKFTLVTLNSNQGQVIIKTLSNLIPVSLFLFPILGVIGFLLFENRPQLQPMFIALFLTVTFGLFSLGGGVAHAAPSRFLPVVGISLSFLLGLLLTWMFDFLRISPKLNQIKPLKKRRHWIANSLMGICLLIVILIIWNSYDDFWQLSNAKVLGLTSEQKVGIWEVKEGISGIQNFIGYVITFLTGVVVLILKLSLGI